MTNDAKTAALTLINSLPDDISWDELQYHLYVRQQIEAGLADDAAGRVVDTAEMYRRLAAHKSSKLGAANG